MLKLIFVYFCIGLLCGIIFDMLMKKTEMYNDTTALERFTWVLFWPFYVIVFLISVNSDK